MKRRTQPEYLVAIVGISLVLFATVMAAVADARPAENTAGFLRISVASVMTHGLASRTAERTDAQGYTAPRCYHPNRHPSRVNCTTSLRYRDEDGTTARVRYIVRAYATRSGAWALMSLAPPYATGLVLGR